MVENFNQYHRVPTKKSVLQFLMGSNDNLKALINTKDGFYFSLSNHPHYDAILDVLHSAFVRTLSGENIDVINKDAKSQVDYYMGG